MITIMAAAADSGSSELIVAVLGAGSFGAILAAVVTGIFSKKKLGAEAAEIITKAASGVVENLNAEILRVNALMVKVRQEAAESEIGHAAELAKQRVANAATLQRQQIRHDQEMEIFRKTLQLHVRWDIEARTELAKHGITLPEAPPLLPALSEDFGG